MEQKLGLLKKFRDRTQKFQQIFQLCQSIQSANQKFVFSKQISEYTQAIEQIITQLTE
jgi:hypothetical protein